MNNKIVDEIKSAFKKFGNNLLFCSLGIILSLLIMRIIIFLFPDYIEMLPIRLVLAAAIIFNDVIPIILVWIYFQKEKSLVLSFLIPFLLYAVLYPVFDAVLLSSLSLILFIPYLIPFITGGFAFALIGVGSYFYNHDRIKSVVFLIFGFLIYILHAINIIFILIFILFGNIAVIESIPNFL